MVFVFTSDNWLVVSITSLLWLGFGQVHFATHSLSSYIQRDDAQVNLPFPSDRSQQSYPDILHCSRNLQKVHAAQCRLRRNAVVSVDEARVPRCCCLKSGRSVAWLESSSVSSLSLRSVGGELCGAVKECGSQGVLDDGCCGSWPRGSISVVDMALICGASMGPVADTGCAGMFS